MDGMGGEEGGEGGDTPGQYSNELGDEYGGKGAGQYQQRHVEFVSSGNGTTPQEILLIGLPIHSSLLLLTSLALWRGNLFSSLPGSLLELLVICLPPLLSLTTFSSSPELLVIPLTAFGVLALFLAARGRSKVPPGPNISQSHQVPRVAYITNYRASMLLITTICILAVDFPVFPRRLAKTENFGFGGFHCLMYLFLKITETNIVYKYVYNIAESPHFQNGPWPNGLSSNCERKLHYLPSSFRVRELL